SSVPQSLRPERWWWPLAAAATIGVVAIGILQFVEPDHVVAPAADKAVVSDTPTTALEKTTKQDAPAASAITTPRRQEEAKRVAPATLPAPASTSEPAPAAKPAAKLRKDAAVPFPREEGARNIAPAPSAPVERGAASAPATIPM